MYKKWITIFDPLRERVYNNCNYMETVNFTKLIRTGNSLAIIIPTAILKAHNWKRGDQLVFGFSNDQLLTVKRPADTEIRELKKITKDGAYSIKTDGTLIDQINV